MPCTGKQRLPLAAGVVILAMFAATATVKVQAVPNFAKDEAPGVRDRLASPAAPATRDVPISPDARYEVRARKTPDAPEPPEAPKPPDTQGGSQQGVLALRVGHSRISINSGKELPPLSGEYIYFEHDGKPFLIQEPSVIAEAQKLLAPMQELAEKQKEFGAEQALLGAQQRVLSSQRVAKIDSAEIQIDTAKFKRDLAQLQSLTKQMDLGELNVRIDAQALAEVQSHIAAIQAAASRLQAQLGQHLRGFGQQQVELGERSRQTCRGAARSGAAATAGHRGLQASAAAHYRAGDSPRQRNAAERMIRPTAHPCLPGHPSGNRRPILVASCPNRRGARPL